MSQLPASLRCIKYDLPEHELRSDLIPGNKPQHQALTCQSPANLQPHGCTANRRLHVDLCAHQTGKVANTTRKDIRIGISASALVCRGLRQPSHGLHGRPRAQLAIHTSGGLQISVTPQRVNTFGAQRSDRLTLLHHRRLCTQLCPCVRRTWPGIIVLTLGSQLLPQRVVSATITSSPRVRILVLLLGLKRLGGTDGATLSICYLNASVSLA